VHGNELTSFLSLKKCFSLSFREHLRQATMTRVLTGQSYKTHRGRTVVQELSVKGPDGDVVPRVQREDAARETGRSRGRFAPGLAPSVTLQHQAMGLWIRLQPQKQFLIIN